MSAIHSDGKPSGKAAVLSSWQQTFFSCGGGTDQLLSVWTLFCCGAGHKCSCCHSKEIESGHFPFGSRLKQ